MWLFLCHNPGNWLQFLKSIDLQLLHFAWNHRDQVAAQMENTELIKHEYSWVCNNVLVSFTDKFITTKALSSNFDCFNHLYIHQQTLPWCRVTSHAHCMPSATSILLCNHACLCFMNLLPEISHVISLYCISQQCEDRELCISWSLRQKQGSSYWWWLMQNTCKLWLGAKIWWYFHVVKMS